MSSEKVVPEGAERDERVSSSVESGSLDVAVGTDGVVEGEGDDDGGDEETGGGLLGGEVDEREGAAGAGGGMGGVGGTGGGVEVGVEGDVGGLECPVGARRCCAANTCDRLLCLLPPDLLANQREGHAKAGSREQPARTVLVMLRNPRPHTRIDRDMAAYQHSGCNRYNDRTGQL